MKLDVDLSKLDRLLNIMGAERKEWTPPPSRREKERAERVKELEEKGIEIDRNDLIVRGDGSLIDKESGEQVVIYIKDNIYASIYHSENIDSPYALRKLHLSDCKTINQKKADETYVRYIASIRKDGFFAVDFKNRENIDRRLWPCENCLEELDYEKFKSIERYEMRRVFKNKFDIAEFFKTGKTYFSEKTKYTDDNDPGSNYAKNHAEIALTIKKKRNWTCEKCRVYLGVYENRKHHLHLHHKNGRKKDNRPSNLQILCEVCHAGIHPHMRVDSETRATIESLRREQGLV